MPAPEISQARVCLNESTGAYASPYCTSSRELKVSLGTIGVTLPNNEYLLARNAADSANINVLKVDGTDDTVLNADTGDLIKLAVAGTTEVQMDTTNFGPAAAGGNALGSVAAPWLGLAYGNGTIVGYTGISVGNSAVTLGSYSNHSVELRVNNTSELAFSSTVFYPWADGGNQLGDATHGFKGAYLSDGTDRWSLVPGTNTITFAAGTSDGSDDQYFAFCAGGAAGNVRGGCIYGYGNENAQKGDIYLVTGNATGSDVLAQLKSSDSEFIITDDSDAILWTFEQGGNLAQGANGGSLVFSKASTGILRATDAGTQFIGGGSDAAVANGAYITLTGDDLGAADQGGVITLQPGNNNNYSYVDIKDWQAVTMMKFMGRGNNLPATCTAGDVYIEANDADCADDDSADGVAVCFCEATNTWVQLDG